MQGRLLSKDARFFDLLRSLPGQLRGCRGGLHQSTLKESFFLFERYEERGTVSIKKKR